MGIVEDAMSAIKTLPGVGYTGSFDARPSIDGGDPSETVATLDGAYILDPYQWSGTYTIFNPDMVDSIKLSDGIIGAPYGQVMSGLLEVNSKTPTDTDRHLDFGFSTTGLDLFFQQAFGTEAGVLLGGKVTWMEVPLTLIGERNLFTTDPYIRNATAKLYWNPSPNVNWTLDANVDTDGVALSVGNINLHLYEEETLVSSALKVLMGKNLLWNLMVSYNTFDTDSGFEAPDRYNTKYSQNVTNSDISTQNEYRYQVRTGFDWTPTASQVISYGVDELLESWSQIETGTTYPFASQNNFSPEVIDTNLTGKYTLTSGIYIDDSYTFIPGVLTGEGGLRLDHSVVYGGGELLQTYPVVNPRLRLTYTFLKNWGPIQSMDVNGGSGLYSQFPADNEFLDSQFGVASLSVGPTRAWFNVLGLDVLGTGGETFNLQGYYKYYLDRFYTATTASGATLLKYDGIGYAFGFDFGIKKQTQFWDFSLSYSFNVTQLLNPWTTSDGTELRLHELGFAVGILVLPLVRSVRHHLRRPYDKAQRRVLHPDPGGYFVRLSHLHGRLVGLAVPHRHKARLARLLSRVQASLGVLLRMRGRPRSTILYPPDRGSLLQYRLPHSLGRLQTQFLG